MNHNFNILLLTNTHTEHDSKHIVSIQMYASPPIPLILCATIPSNSIY